MISFMNCTLHQTGHIIKVIKTKTMKWMGHGKCTSKIRNVYKILVRKPERRRPLGRKHSYIKG
jgi:hypothetical protein